jgi:hypothetical protein
MHARPEIRQCLIEIRMARWCRLAKYHYLASTCPPARARKNFWRLIKAHPETAERLGYTATSVYER